jgi:hypothetical protein
MLALTLAVPTPATAAPAVPTQTEIEAGLAKFVGSLPPPSRAGAKPITQVMQLSGQGASTQLVIVCVGRSILNTIGVQGFNYEVAESSTECPVAIDYVAAQTWLFRLDTFVNEWVEMTAGPLDGHPGLLARSQTIQFACPADEALFAALGYHYVRLGDSIAVAYTFYPGASRCRLQA